MMAFSPDGLSWQKTTCSWPVSLPNTSIAAPVGEARGPLWGTAHGDGPAGWCRLPMEPNRMQAGGTFADVPAIFAAYLGVYEPLTAFDRERQLYWRRYVKEGRAIAPLDGPGRQRTVVLEALGAGWTRLPDLPDEAYVLETDETLLICPWNLRVRVAEAALSARDGVPPGLAAAFVPPILAGSAKTAGDVCPGGARGLRRGVATDTRQGVPPAVLPARAYCAV